MDKNIQAKAAEELSSVELKTDGTISGTQLKVNGNKVDNLRDLSIYITDSSYDKRVYISYSVGDKLDDVESGQLGSVTTYRLAPRAHASAKASFVAERNNAVIPPNDARNVFATAFIPPTNRR